MLTFLHPSLLLWEKCLQFHTHFSHLICCYLTVKSSIWQIMTSLRLQKRLLWQNYLFLENDLYGVIWWKFHKMYESENVHSGLRWNRLWFLRPVENELIVPLLGALSDNTQFHFIVNHMLHCTPCVWFLFLLLCVPFVHNNLLDSKVRPTGLLSLISERLSVPLTMLQRGTTICSCAFSGAMS